MISLSHGRMLIILALGSSLAAAANPAPDADPQLYLDWMRANLADVPEWNAWQEQTGELPPDFQSLPGSEFLPDPLLFRDGDAVDSPAEWPRRRQEILDNYQHYLLGRFPPKPELVRIVPIEFENHSGYSTRQVRLEYGPGGQATMRVEISLPDGPGPHPAVITPRLGGWKEHLIPRGYAAVGFAGNDFMDDTAGLPELYPEYDFAKIPRRAWAVQVVMETRKASISGVQRRLKIGYNRAARMVESMEAAGLVGPLQPNGSREILVPGGDED